jgi:hypothetical protein
MNTPVQMPSEEPPQLASPAIQHAEHHGTASGLQAPVQVIRQRGAEVPVEPPVLFQPGFLPNWEDKMNLSKPGQLSIYPALTE